MYSSISRTVVKRLLLLSLLFFSQGIYAQENTQVNDKNQRTTKLPADSDCVKANNANKVKTDDIGWMEKLHSTVSDSVFQSAVWFDNFFIDENSEQESPKTTARIRLGWEPKARDLGEFDTRFRIKVKLPHLKDKVDLILSDDDDLDQSYLPLESVNAKPNNENDHFSAAVRITHSKSSNRRIESRIGISGGDIFVRAKHERRLNWSENHSFKIEPSVYYFLDDGLGAKLLMEYDYQIDKTSQLRVNYSVRGSNSFSGIRWKHGFYRLKQLQQNAASIMALQVEGERNGENGFVIDKYTLSYRYRFSAVKEWLFFEIEPFVEWPEEENYTTTPGLALRVEGYFSKGY
ncbi:hypothetical protein [Thalassotalea marina]|uniref:hypothetical protein n=1 Tax=Thalassotalea marina TaxID=1673741 RepID=UPI0016731D18|nr:hypothetical protein [Thalassotalea marina]